MENDEKDTWTYLTHSGEQNAINSDIGSLSSSSIEFIQDDMVHYGPRKRRGTGNGGEEAVADEEEIEEDPIEFIDSIENIPSNEIVPLQHLSLNRLPSSAPHPTEKASPISQTGSEDSSDSVTVLSVPNSDIENLPEDFWFDSDFELLNQQSFSDLAYLQLAARTGCLLNSSDQCDLKFRNSELGNAICQNGISDASDADDECSNNAGSISAEEFEQNPPDSPMFSQTVSTVSATPTPCLVHSSQSEMSSLVGNNQRNVPKWSCGFLILLVFALGVFHAFSIRFYYGASHFKIPTDDSDHFKQMETVYQLNEQNKLLMKHVQSLKQELRNVLSSKHLLSEELHEMNNLLRNRITNLDHQIVELRQDISGVISKAETTDPSGDILEDVSSTDIPGVESASDIPGFESVSNIPGFESVSNIPGFESVSNIPGVEPASDIPGVEPASDIPGVEPASDIPGVEPASDIPGVEPASDILGVEPASDIPGVEPASDIPGVEPASDIPGVEPASDIPGVELVSDIPAVNFKTESVGSIKNTLMVDPSSDTPVVESSSDIPAVISKTESTHPSTDIPGGTSKTQTTELPTDIPVQTLDQSNVTKEGIDPKPGDTDDKETDEFSAPLTNYDANKKQERIPEGHHSKMLVLKLQREIKKVELWKRLYFHKRYHSNDSNYSENARDVRSLNELLKELSFAALNFSGNSTVTLETLRQLMSSSMVELSQTAQNWKNYVTEKLQNFTDSQNQKTPHQETNEKLKRPLFKNFDSYAKRMVDKLHTTKEKLQRKFQKTIGKIGSKLDNFLLKNKLPNFFNLKTQEPTEEILKQYEGRDNPETRERVNTEKYHFKKPSLWKNKHEDGVINTRQIIHTVNLNKEPSVNEEYSSNSKTFSLSNGERWKKSKEKSQQQHRESKKTKRERGGHLNTGKHSDKGRLLQQKKRDRGQLYDYKQAKEHSHKERNNNIINNDKVRLYRQGDNKKTHFQVEENEDKIQKGKERYKKYSAGQRVKEKYQSDHFDQKYIKEKKRKRSNKDKYNFQSFSRKSSQKEQQEYSGKKSSKRSNHFGEKQHLKCKKKLNNIEKKIKKVSQENFSYMKHHKVRQLAFTLFHYNKDCLHETVQPAQAWSMCQQIWWALCWQGLLIANPPNSRCYNHLLPWQLAVTASPGSYIGCDSCGCSHWSVHFNDTYSDNSEEKFGCNKIDCNANYERLHQERMPMSGMWYFKEDNWRLHHNGMEPTLEDETNWYIKMMEARQPQHQ